MGAFRSYSHQSNEKTFRYTGGMDYSNTSGRSDVLLYYLGRCLVLVTEMPHEDQDQQWHCECTHGIKYPRRARAVPAEETGYS